MRLTHNHIDVIAHGSTRAADHVCDDHNLTDPAHRLSAHRVSAGRVVYYRCSCGRARVGLIRP
jgi:hypothetical protein